MSDPIRLDCVISSCLHVGRCGLPLLSACQGQGATCHTSRHVHGHAGAAAFSFAKAGPAVRSMLDRSAYLWRPSSSCIAFRRLHKLARENVYMFQNVVCYNRRRCLELVAGKTLVAWWCRYSLRQQVFSLADATFVLRVCSVQTNAEGFQHFRCFSTVCACPVLHVTRPCTLLP